MLNFVSFLVSNHRFFFSQCIQIERLSVALKFTLKPQIHKYNYLPLFMYEYLCSVDKNRKNKKNNQLILHRILK